MNSNLNKHEEKEKKPITVSWQDGDTTHVQTTVIHKRVPSAVDCIHVYRYRSVHCKHRFPCPLYGD